MKAGAPIPQWSCHATKCLKVMTDDPNSRALAGLTSIQMLHFVSRNRQKTSCKHMVTSDRQTIVSDTLTARRCPDCKRLMSLFGRLISDFDRSLMLWFRLLSVCFDSFPVLISGISFQFLPRSYISQIMLLGFHFVINCGHWMGAFRERIWPFRLLTALFHFWERLVWPPLIVKGTVKLQIFCYSLALLQKDRLVSSDTFL